MNANFVQLKWMHFRDEVASTFEELFNQDDFADVTLSCEGRYVKAHRIILSSCSPYFHDLFKSHPCQHPIIILQDVGYEILEALMMFIYRGEVDVDQGLLPSILKVASVFKIKGLATDKQSDARSSVPVMQNTRTDRSLLHSEDPIDFLPKNSKLSHLSNAGIINCSTNRNNSAVHTEVNYSHELLDNETFEQKCASKLEPEEITLDDSNHEDNDETNDNQLCDQILGDPGIFSLNPDYDMDINNSETHIKSLGEDSVLKWLLMTPANNPKRRKVMADYPVFSGKDLKHCKL